MASRHECPVRVAAAPTGRQGLGLHQGPAARSAVRQHGHFRGGPLGIERIGDAAKRRVLADWLTHTVRPMFEGRVLPISEDVMVRWRFLIEDGRKIGHTFSQPDLIIAATGLQHGLVVVFRDVDEFETARARVFNP